MGDALIDRERPQRGSFVSRTVLIAVGGVVVLALLIAAVLVFASGRAAVTVPDVIGLDEGVADVRLAQSGLTSRVAERRFDTSPAGTVLSQDPASGSSLREGDTVELVVSAGTEQFTLPDLIGLSVRVAQAQLQQLGLVVRIDTMVSDAPVDTVLMTNPAPGASVRTSDIVRLTVASEGSPTDALLPYGLSGSRFVIDPAPVDEGAVDVPAEVARRLQSLLEASGATVTVTRSAVTTQTTAEDRVALTVDAAPGVVIGIDVAGSGPGGLSVATLVEDAAPASFQATRLLAEEISTQLRADGSAVEASSLTADPVLQAVPVPGLRVSLGSVEQAEDTSRFRDPAWTDAIARAIYVGVGERLGTR